MGSTMSKTRTLLKAYLVFGALHTILKVGRLLYDVRRYKMMLYNCPGRKGFIGKTFFSNVNRVHDWHTDYCNEFPGASVITTEGPGLNVIAKDAEAVKYILKILYSDFDKPCRKNSHLFYFLEEFLGKKGIFILKHGKGVSKADDLDHDMWYEQRKCAAKLFTKRQYENFMHTVFIEKANFIKRLLDKHVAEDVEIDMQNVFFVCTMNSIQKLFFGRDIDTLEKGVDVVGDAFDNAHRNMMRCFIEMVPLLTVAASVLPWPFGFINSDPDSSWLVNLRMKTLPSAIEFRRNVAILHKEIDKIIDDTRADPNIQDRNDLLSNFMKFSKTELSNEYLRHVILNFIIAGRDTTACLLSWLFFELSTNHEIQKKLQEEVDSVIGIRSPSLEELVPQNMPYLNACVMEALRLHPPIPEEQKMTKKDVTFPCGARVPKGTLIVFLAYSMGRDPTRYKNPLKFDPDRWIPYTAYPEAYEFPVFQGGYRECLGKETALFEIKLLTSILMQNYNFTLRPGEEKNIMPALMINFVYIWEAKRIMGSLPSTNRVSPKEASKKTSPIETPNETQRSSSELNETGTSINAQGEPSSDNKTVLTKKEALSACKIDHNALLECYGGSQSWLNPGCRNESKAFWDCFTKARGSRRFARGLDKVQELGQSKEYLDMTTEDDLEAQELEVKTS